MLKPSSRPDWPAAQPPGAAVGFEATAAVPAQGITMTKPTTHQRDLAKLPRALAPLIERPQWCVWRWTQKLDGKWQKPPYQARDPQRHASSTDPSTWSDYPTALAAVQAGHADGITYMLTADDPFAAIDLDHCRDPDTRSIDIWAQLFLERGRETYAEVTPSGDGVRIWGLANGAALNSEIHAGERRQENCSRAVPAHQQGADDHRLHSRPCDS